MALDQSDSVAGRGPSAGDNGALWIAAILLLTVAVALGMRAVVSLDALAPAVATLLFGAAAAAAGVGLLLHRFGLQIGLTELAGLLTFIGIGISLFIEPEQMLRLVTLSEQADASH